MTPEQEKVIKDAMSARDNRTLKNIASGYVWGCIVSGFVVWLFHGWRAALLCPATILGTMIFTRLAALILKRYG